MNIFNIKFAHLTTVFFMPSLGLVWSSVTLTHRVSAKKHNTMEIIELLANAFGDFGNFYTAAATFCEIFIVMNHNVWLPWPTTHLASDRCDLPNSLKLDQPHALNRRQIKPPSSIANTSQTSSKDYCVVFPLQKIQKYFEYDIRLFHLCSFFLSRRCCRRFYELWSAMALGNKQMFTMVLFFPGGVVKTRALSFAIKPLGLCLMLATLLTLY